MFAWGGLLILAAYGVERVICGHNVPNFRPSSVVIQLQT